MPHSLPQDATQKYPHRPAMSCKKVHQISSLPSSTSP